MTVHPEPETAERICHAAASLFRKNGFHGTSMQDLAELAGISKSSLYHHYPSKQALLATIIEVTMTRVTPLIRNIVEANGPAAERLHRALVLHTAESIEERDYLACFSEESRYLSADFMSPHLEGKERYERLFQGVIEQGIADGEFIPLDPTLARMAILGMCDSVIRRYPTGTDHSPEQIATAFADAALRSLMVWPDGMPS